MPKTEPQLSGYGSTESALQTTYTANDIKFLGKNKQCLTWETAFTILIQSCKSRSTMNGKIMVTTEKQNYKIETMRNHSLVQLVNGPIFASNLLDCEGKTSQLHHNLSTIILVQVQP